MWEYEFNKRFAHLNTGGKWMMFYKSDAIDAAWTIIKRLYNAGSLIGINGMKRSVTTGPRASSSELVIICYCGLSSDKENVLAFGKNLVRLMNYQSRNGHIYYKTDEQTINGTKATGVNVNHNYKLNLTIVATEDPLSFVCRCSVCKGHTKWPMPDGRCPFKHPIIKSYARMDAFLSTQFSDDALQQNYVLSGKKQSLGMQDYAFDYAITLHNIQCVIIIDQSDYFEDVAVDGFGSWLHDQARQYMRFALKRRFSVIRIPYNYICSAKNWQDRMTRIFGKIKRLTKPETAFIDDNDEYALFRQAIPRGQSYDAIIKKSCDYISTFDEIVDASDDGGIIYNKYDLTWIFSEKPMYNVHGFHRQKRNFPFSIVRHGYEQAKALAINALQEYRNKRLGRTSPVDPTTIVLNPDSEDETVRKRYRSPNQI